MYALSKWLPILNNIADHGNEFVKITLARQTIAGVGTAAGAVVINGKQVTATKVMLYKRIWIQNNYFNPLADVLSSVNTRQPSRSIIGHNSVAPDTTSTPSSTTSTATRSDHSYCYYLCCCYCCYCCSCCSCCSCCCD